MQQTGTVANLANRLKSIKAQDTAEISDMTRGVLQTLKSDLKDLSGSALSTTKTDLDKLSDTSTKALSKSYGQSETALTNINQKLTTAEESIDNTLAQARWILRTAWASAAGIFILTIAVLYLIMSLMTPAEPVLRNATVQHLPMQGDMYSVLTNPGWTTCPGNGPKSPPLPCFKD